MYAEYYLVQDVRATRHTNHRIGPGRTHTRQDPAVQTGANSELDNKDYFRMHNGHL
jgi:hypothetical protein